MFQLWRLIQFLKNSNKFGEQSGNFSQGSSNLSVDEAYKLLGLKKGCKRRRKKSSFKFAKKKFTQI